MAAFNTRVELHSANCHDYETLHTNMTAAGFTNTIRGGNGKTYRLPSAEYNYEGSPTIDTIDDIREKAKLAAGAVKNSFAVYVTEAGIRTWYGLASE